MDKRNPSYSQIFIVGSLGLTAFTASFAEDAEITHELPPFVVVSTRTPLGLDRVSPSVSYISEEEMNFWQDRSLVDALRREPGMPVIPSGTEGSLTSLFVRGTNSNHTSIFLDGRRLNPGFSNQFGIDVVSTVGLESIQIQRGPSSVNYGSNGIGGVIDLRTRSGFDAVEPTFETEAEIGSNNYYRGAFDVAFSEADLGVSVSGSWLDVENERENDGFERKSATTRMDYMLSEDFSLELIAQYAEGDKEVPGSTASPSTNQNNETTAWLVSPGLKYLTDELSVHFFYSRSEHELVNLEPGQRDEISMESDEVNLQIDYSFTDLGLLTVGAVYREDAASDNNVAFFGPAMPFDETYKQEGVFAQFIWQSVEAFELRGGLRYDDFSEFGDEWTWHAEVIYYLNVSGLSLFGKYATSFVPPRTSDIAFDSDPVTDPGPESSKSYEIGLRQELFKGKLVIEAVLFRNEIEDLITFNYTGVGFSGFDIANVNEATTEGIEISINYLPTEKLGLGVGYTYLEAVNEETDERLVRRPRHILQLYSNYNLSESIRFGVFGTGYFAREDFQITPPFSQVEIEDYFTVDLVADWKINRNWTVFARVDNLLDEEYEATLGFPALGRAGYIGARFQF